MSIIARYGFEDAKPLAIPMEPGIMLSTDDCPKTDQERAIMRVKPYREAVGALLYLVVATRPDISYAVLFLARFVADPGLAHWNALSRVFRYLIGTQDWQLTYGSPDGSDLFGYTDADGMSTEGRRAISGYVFMMNGGAVSWSTKRQDVISLSTTEAEYIAQTHAAKEAIWL